MAALEKKDFARAWQHLIKAKDEDGWPLRVLSDINERIRTVMGGSGNVADVEADVLRAVEKGDSFDALFADFQHPNLRGQILMARSFISKLPDFRSRRAVAAKFDSLLEPESPAVDSYRQELGIAASTVVADAGKNLEWLLELRRYAVDEAIFFDVAVRAWSRMEAAGSARYEAGRAVLLAFTQHPPLAEITRLLASARTRSRSQANVVLDNGLPGLPAEEIRGKFRSLQLEGSR